MANVLITGASSGLGLSHAIYLSFLGKKVIGTTRNAQKIDKTILKEHYLRDHTLFKYLDKSTLKLKLGKSLVPDAIKSKLDEILDRIHFISLDVTSMDSVQAGVQETFNLLESENQTLDVLINNAGNGYFGSIEELSLENVQDQFNTNYFGTVRMIQAVIPHFRQLGKGRIINTASMAGLVPIPFQGHYAASKAAILRMTETLRIELMPFHILVCSVAPGDINTNFNANTTRLYNDQAQTTSQDLQEMLESIPIPPNSPYQSAMMKVWRRIVENLIVSSPPIVVSKVISQIINTPKPKMHYLVGSLSQRIQMILLRRFVSDDFGVDGSANFYGLK